MRDQSERVAQRVRQLLLDHAQAHDPDAARPDDLDAARPDDLDAARPDDPDVGRPDDPTAAGPVPARPGWRARWPLRVDPGRRSALAVGVAVLVAAVLTGGWVLLQRPQAAPVAASAPGVAGSATPVGSAAPSADVPSAAPGASGSAPASSVPASPLSSASSAPDVVVDVAGKVRRPGLYRLAPGSRIDDAVRAAGGPLAGVDLARLNLAQPLVDGQQIVVGAATQPPVPGAPAGGAGGGSGGGPTAAGGSVAGTPVDLNTATLDQLETLPGVGPVLAQHILDFRTQHGSFTGVAQLDDVPGIGTVKFAALKPLVSV